MYESERFHKSDKPMNQIISKTQICHMGQIGHMVR